ncbi:MAG: PEGA domain-containing protein [Deltaproteobacteria bacterium]|nr:PEGA domain-containing protein [Deltaproteobacteria bacterium]
MTDRAAPRSAAARVSRSAAIALLVGLAVAPRATHAQQPCDASCHNRLGIEAVERSDFARAVVEFAEAYRLDPSPRRLNNLARAEVALGRIDDAIAHYTLFLRAPGDAAPEVVTEARSALERLRAMAGAVTIDARPAGATVRVDGREVGQAPLVAPVTLSVGSHQLEVSAPGYVVHQRALAVTRGPQTVVVALVAEPASAAAPPPPRVVARAAAPPAALRPDDDREPGGGGLLASPIFWGVVGAVVVGAAVTVGIVVASGDEPTTILQPPTVRAE